MTDVRLSDGSVIPLGTKVAVANYYSLHDEVQSPSVLTSTYHCFDLHLERLSRTGRLQAIKVREGTGC